MRPACGSGRLEHGSRQDPERRALRDGRRPRQVQRLRRVRGRLRRREQRAARGRARDRAQRHHLAARPPDRGPGRRPCRLPPHDVPAVRRQDALRVGLPAERGRGGPGLGHRRPGPGALPRLPLLHGRVPVPRAVLQLVGPRLAGPARRDAQPRGLDADARRRREVHLLHSPAPGRAGRAGRGRWRREPPAYTPACAEACPTGAIVFGNLDDPQSEVARLTQAPGTFRLLERLGTGAKSTTTPSATGCVASPTAVTPAGDGRTHG